MNLIVPDWPAPSGVGALCTTREGGVSAVPYDDGKGGGGLNLGMHVGDRPDSVQENRAILQSCLPAAPAWLEQVHGNRVVEAASVPAPVQADASVATRAGVVCAVMTADCLPVLLCDSAGQVVAAAHAGWRGLAGGVLENTVAHMRAVTGDDILAWLGPAIGPQRFEVGAEVRQEFIALEPDMAGAFVPVAGSQGKFLADIYRLARITLNNIGVERIYGGDFCTVTDSGRFYSFRRDKVTGRMASLIWIR